MTQDRRDQRGAGEDTPPREAGPRPARNGGPPPPRGIYTPETPDALRDGLYQGFHAHRRPEKPRAE